VLGSKLRAETRALELEFEKNLDELKSSKQLDSIEQKRKV